MICARDADCVEQVRDLTGGGVDYAFDQAGSTDSMALAYAMVQYGGTVVVMRTARGGNAAFSVNQNDLVSQEKIDTRQLSRDRACRCATFRASSASTRRAGCR